MNSFYAVLIFVLSFILSSFYLNWPQSCLCDIPGRLEGKVALVTDGPSFMGLEVISEFTRRGATVLVGAQSQEHFNIVRDNVLRFYGDGGERINEDFATEEVRKHLTIVKESQMKFMQVHLNSIQNIREFATQVMRTTDRLDFLVNNAAVSHGPYGRTTDDFESTMGVGHLAHYLLTELLSPLLLRTQPSARIITISSAEHKSGSFAKFELFVPRDKFNSVVSLAQVKLANVIHNILLAERFKGTTVTPVCLHPGYVLPNLGVFIPSIFGMFFKTRWEAGQAVLHAILAENLQPGGYYSNCELTAPSYEARNETIVNFVKSESEKLLKISTPTFK